jgi:hypothetical protein
MTFDSRKFLGLGINEILEGTARSIGICTLRIRMDLALITLYLNKKHLPAAAIHTEINSVLAQGTIGYSTVIHYLRKQSFVNVLHLAPEEPDLGRLTQLLMLFCKCLTNSLLRHLARLPRGH